MKPLYRGYYSAASGLLTNQALLNTVTNNISNSRTSGYKRDTAISTTFGEHLASRLEWQRGQNNLGAMTPIRYQQSINTDYSQGSYEFTDSPFDLAIEGDALFLVEGVDGQEYLTRNGQFNLDSEGYLISQGGGHLMGEGGPIMVEGSNFVVQPNGEVYVDDELLDTVTLVYPDDVSTLPKYNETLFVYDGQGSTEPQEEGKPALIKQFAYERSNVEVAEEMMASIEIQRAFQSCSQALKIIDTVNGKAISELSRVQG